MKPNKYLKIILVVINYATAVITIVLCAIISVALFADIFNINY